MATLLTYEVLRLKLAEWKKKKKKNNSTEVISRTRAGGKENKEGYGKSDDDDVVQKLEELNFDESQLHLQPWENALCGAVAGGIGR